MQRETVYKIIIGILTLAVIILFSLLIFKKPAKKEVTLKAPCISGAVKGKIAVVIDDLGYNMDNLNILDGIKFPVTFSILPNLNYSKTIAQELNKRGFEIMLHLPMEPHEKIKLENNTILTSMDENKIREIIGADLSSIAYTKGVSNHMGSLASEDSKIMTLIFSELKKRHLYFLDSFVTGKSVAAQLAQKVALRFAKRDVFLDNNLDPGYIREQLRKLKIKARVKGVAIGIGHDRKITLEVLKEVMPELDREGYKFVFVSDLAR
jgi:polysaccharide deacetylase 2 family uncharacterized protein YibQ